MTQNLPAEEIQEIFYFKIFLCQKMTTIISVSFEYYKLGIKSVECVFAYLNYLVKTDLQKSVSTGRYMQIIYVEQN